MWGECLSGALFIDDFREIIEGLGFGEIRRVLSSSVDLDDNPKIKEQCGDIKFASWTVRLYKLHNL